MWTPTITSKEFKEGRLWVNVSYSNGTDQFNEVYPLNSAEQLDSLIKSKLTQLTSLDTLNTSLVLGIYTPTPNVVDTPVADPIKDAINQYSVLKSYVDLGLLPATDPTVVAAQAAASDAVANTVASLTSVAVAKAVTL